MIKLVSTKKLIYLCLSFSVFLIISQNNTYALEYYVGAREQQGAGLAIGNTGANYIMQNPVSVSNGRHLNSIYVEYSSYNFTEIGWEHRWGWTYAKTFWAYEQSANYYSGYIRDVGRGQNMTFKVAVDTGTTTWWWIINGVKQNPPWYKVLGFGRGTATGGSEKSIKNDSNYSHWWSMQVKRSQGDYRYWQYLGPDGDNDPYYNLQLITNSEFYTRS